MNIKVLKSTEIDEQTWLEITVGFNESFERLKTANEFISYYKNTVLTYSYHAIAFDVEGELAGSTTIVPHFYNINGNKYLLGVSGGTFVKKKFRSDIFIYEDMMNALLLYCKNEGIIAVYGVPNRNSFKYTIEFLKFNYLFDLNYFVLPLKIANVYKMPLKPLVNFISSILSSFLIKLNCFTSFIIDWKVIPSKVAINFDDLFVKARFGNDYKVIKKKGWFIAYKITTEKSVKTAFLMEYRQNGIRNYRSIAKAVDLINKTEKVDIITFIGTIRHLQFSFFKVPIKKHPQKLPLTIKILTSDENLKSILYSKENWEFSLVNFDVR